MTDTPAAPPDTHIDIDEVRRRLAAIQAHLIQLQDMVAAVMADLDRLCPPHAGDSHS